MFEHMSHFPQRSFIVQFIIHSLGMISNSIITQTPPPLHQFLLRRPHPVLRFPPLLHLQPYVQLVFSANSVAPRDTDPHRVLSIIIFIILK